MDHPIIKKRVNIQQESRPKTGHNRITRQRMVLMWSLAP